MCDQGRAQSRAGPAGRSAGSQHVRWTAGSSAPTIARAGLDRAVTAVERHGLDGPAQRRRGIRDDIHAQVCNAGFDARRNTFTQSYGSTALDVATLLLPRVGFLPWDDPRIVGTVQAVQHDLCSDGLLLRYRTEGAGVDGLPGTEGAFLACSFWLVDALHGVGLQHEAVELFERLLELRNDVGLLAEEYGPHNRANSVIRHRRSALWAW